jgi:hypothetical protein
LEILNTYDKIGAVSPGPARFRLNTLPIHDADVRVEVTGFEYEKLRRAVHVRLDRRLLYSEAAELAAGKTCPIVAATPFAGIQRPLS